MDSAPLSAAILAGGAARRMGGTNKALLEVGGRAVIEHQLEVLRQVADPVAIIANDAEPYRHLGAPVVPDLIPGRAAIGGIYTAVMWSPHARVLVVGCDMPFLRLPLLQLMAARASERNADVVIPRRARGLEPLCAIYARSCAPALRARIDAGALEAAVMPEGVSVEEIGPETLAVYDPDGQMFVNVNTPHDYARARELADAPSKPAQDRIMDER